MIRISTIFILLVLLISCGKDDVVITPVDDEIQAWLDTMNITASREDNTGIYYYPEVANPSGAQAASGSVVAIYYTLSDLNGNVIASHQRSNGDSLIFQLDAAAVYPIGVNTSVSLMRLGETYNFVLPPSQAYQELTSGAINHSLIALLQVELVGIHNESDLFAQELVDIDNYIASNNLNDTNANPLDPVELFSASGISYKRLSAGNGPLPLNGDTIIVDYTGRFINNTTFDSGDDFEWVFGSGQPRELLAGFRFGVSLMQRGERALFMIPSSQGYRESALVIPNFITNDLIEDAIIPDYVSKVPPYRTLLFEITRVN